MLDSVHELGRGTSRMKKLQTQVMQFRLIHTAWMVRTVRIHLTFRWRNTQLANCHCVSGCLTFDVNSD